MPNYTYEDEIKDIILNEEKWEDEVYGLIDPDEDEVLTW